MSHLFLISLAVCGLGQPIAGGSTQTRRVDLIELNRFQDHEGREVFRQVIFYDWSPAAKAFHVRHWRMIRRDDELPLPTSRDGSIECRWTEKGRTRIVQAKQLRRSSGQKDPEQLNRHRLPEDQRQPLFR